jgi:hypothetical protein
VEERVWILNTSVVFKNIDLQPLMKLNVKIFGKIKRKRLKKSRLFKRRQKSNQKVKIDLIASIIFF